MNRSIVHFRHGLDLNIVAINLPTRVTYLHQFIKLKSTIYEQTRTASGVKSWIQSWLKF